MGTEHFSLIKHQSLEKSFKSVSGREKMADKEWDNRVEVAEDAAKQLCDNYYMVMDKKRQQIHKLYSEQATLIWDGNKVDTQDAIGKFLKDLPISNHRIDSLDVQPVDEVMTDGTTSFLIGVSGSVKFDKKSYLNFNQHFVVSKIDNKLKIISDTNRLCEQHRR